LALSCPLQLDGFDVATFASCFTGLVRQQALVPPGSGLPSLRKHQTSSCSDRLPPLVRVLLKKKGIIFSVCGGGDPHVPTSGLVPRKTPGTNLRLSSRVVLPPRPLLPPTTPGIHLRQRTGRKQSWQHASRMSPCSSSSLTPQRSASIHPCRRVGQA
ncbi:unnamed protein product, partial [Ectocarpus sp. 13 AM-2016]